MLIRRKSFPPDFTSREIQRSLKRDSVRKGLNKVTMANLRPWRKLKLQVFVTDKWNDHVEDQPDGALAQVGGHGAWDKDQAIQVSPDIVII